MSGGGYGASDAYEGSASPKMWGTSSGDASNNGGGDDMQKSCPLLTFLTPLNSVDPNTINALKIGDKLSIGEQEGSIVAIAPDGKVAGSITAVQLARLSACMGAGYRYVGIVEDIIGGTCMIRIRCCG